MIGTLIASLILLGAPQSAAKLGQAPQSVQTSSSQTANGPLDAPVDLPSDGLTPEQAKEEDWDDSPDNRDPNNTLYISPTQWKAILSDIKLGDQYAKEVLKDYKPSTNKEYQAKIEKIGYYLAGIANTTKRTALWGDKKFSKFPYTFTVLQGSDVNAFSIFGGHVYVFEGLIKYAESDDELAGTLAHEISHIAFRHLATLDREQNKLSVLTLPLILIGILSGANGGGAFMAGSLLNQAFGSGWSQKAETAADYGGLQILEHSKFPPYGILTLMEHLGRDERLGPTLQLGIFRTHPPSPQRAQALISEMESVGIKVQRSVSSTTFSTSVKPADNGAVEVQYEGSTLCAFRGDHAVKRAEEARLNINAFLDTLPELNSVHADADGTIYGGDSALFQLLPQDLLNGQVLDTVSQVTVKAIENAIYRYKYLVYLSDGPGGS